MPDIVKIIEAIDSYLKKNKLKYVNPVDANNELSLQGLLSDSVSRPGNPLRKLLRDGKIPHAYQVGGKGSHWIIPLSKSK